MKQKMLFLGLYLFFLLVMVTGASGGESLVLATTTSTKDSGLLDVLLPEFEQTCGYRVKAIAVGTGQALKLGETGDADVVLVHSPQMEEKFVVNGFGVDRTPVMYNDFVIVGPVGDPAKIRELPVVQAMKILLQGKSFFLSRGDESGTHQKERDLWREVGGVPDGSWYKSVGKGMGETLVMADELAAYTLADRGTYAAMKQKLHLVALVQGDRLLLNPYSIIAVNPKRHPVVNYNGARALIAFFVSRRGRDLINGYWKNGEQLFHTF